MGTDIDVEEIINKYNKQLFDKDGNNIIYDGYMGFDDRIEEATKSIKRYYLILYQVEDQIYEIEEEFKSNKKIDNDTIDRYDLLLDIAAGCRKEIKEWKNKLEEYENEEMKWKMSGV